MPEFQLTYKINDYEEDNDEDCSSCLPQQQAIGQNFSNSQNPATININS